MLRLLFTAADDLISGAIRKISNSGVSHVGIQTGENKVLSAEADGIAERSMDEFMSGGRTLVACYQATPEGEKHLLVWRARGHIGNKYAFKEVVGLAWVCVLRMFGRRRSNPVHNPKQEFCSELPLYLDDETGKVTEFIGLDPETTTPGDLLTRLRLGGPTFYRVFDNGA